MNRCSLRSLSLASLPLFALTLGSADVRALTLVQNGAFATIDQSLWQQGPGFHPTRDGPLLGVDWAGGSLSTTASGPGADAFAAVQLAPGYFGFRPTLEATTGVVSVSYPIQISYTLPDTVAAGQPFTVSTDWANGANPLLTTLGPKFSLKMNAEADIHLSAGGGIDVSGLPVAYTAAQPGDPAGFAAPIPQALIDAHAQDLTLFSTFGPLSVPVFQVDPSVNPIATFTLDSGTQILSITAQAPTPIAIEVNAFTAPNTLAGGGGSSPFVSFNVDLANAMAALLGLPPLNASASAAGITVGYNIVTGQIRLGPAIAQDVSFTATGFPITLTTSDGQVVSGHLGDDFIFTAPPDCGPLFIDAVVDIANTFTNDTGVAFGADFNWSLLGLTAGFGYGPFTVTPYSFGPLLSGTTLLYNSGNLFSLYNTSFALTGFNSLDQGFELRVIPEPATLLLLAAGLLALGRHRRPAAGAH